MVGYIKIMKQSKITKPGELFNKFKAKENSSKLHKGIKKTGTFKGKSNKLGGGGRFAQVAAKAGGGKKGAAIAAMVGRRSLGKKKFQSLAAAGKKKHKTKKKTMCKKHQKMNCKMCSK